MLYEVKPVNLSSMEIEADYIEVTEYATLLLECRGNKDEIVKVCPHHNTVYVVESGMSKIKHK